MKKLFIIAAAALVGMASCSKEGPAVKYDGAEGTGKLAFFLNSDAKTRAEGDAVNGTEDESKVNSVEIYIFEADGETLEAVSEGYVTVTGPDFGDFVSDESEFAPELDGKYVTTVAVGAGEDYQILVVTNAELGEPGDRTLMELQAEVAAHEFSVTNTTAVPADGFVMAGVNLAATVEAEQTNTIEVDIYRNVSRITKPTEKAGGAEVDLDALTQGQLDDVFGAGVVTAGDTQDVGFTLTGYAVVNGMIKSTVGFAATGDAEDGTFDPLYVNATPTYNNEWTAWDAGRFTGLNWAPQVTATNGATELALGRIQSNSAELKANNTPVADIADWEGVYSGDGKMIKMNGDEPNIYLYESKPGLLKEAVGTYEGYNADQVISIIIEGELVVAGEGDFVRYWRINMRPDEAYHLIRNSEYQTVINKISTLGYDTPWEAEESEDIIAKPNDTITDFIINVVPWDVKIVGPTQI